MKISDNFFDSLPQGKSGEIIASNNDGKLHFREKPVREKLIEEAMIKDSLLYESWFLTEN